MKSHRTLLAFGLLLSSLAPAQEPAAEAPLPPNTAVLDFKDGSPDLEGTGASVSAILQAKLSAASNAAFVERAELNEILGEQELTLAEAVTPGQAARVGQLTGAEALVSGRVFPVQSKIYVVAKVISTSSGRVFGATSNYEDGGNMDAAVDELAGQIAKLLEDKAGDLRGDTPFAERQLEAIKEKLKGKPSPKVHVAVTEQILRAEVIDPAVETEIKRTLQAAGWTVVDQATEADLVVTGEAVAETGSRREALWFTRARLEFTVKDADDKTLKVDRLTCGNVDLTESAAGKGALQKAGLIASGIVADAWLDAAN